MANSRPPNQWPNKGRLVKRSQPAALTTAQPSLEATSITFQPYWPLLHTLVDSGDATIASRANAAMDITRLHSHLDQLAATLAKKSTGPSSNGRREPCVEALLDRLMSQPELIGNPAISAAVYRCLVYYASATKLCSRSDTNGKRTNPRLWAANAIRQLCVSRQLLAPTLLNTLDTQGQSVSAAQNQIIETMAEQLHARMQAATHGHHPIEEKLLATLCRQSVVLLSSSRALATVEQVLQLAAVAINANPAQILSPNLQQLLDQLFHHESLYFYQLTQICQDR
ncbi:hypothetical protein H4R34_002861 [Dimargaris verticillata]|uniref:Uncharacterized protein n=1 Tax=Dimargaris verticillata TaxID=2761393 RepID=A0A9W8B7C8_9FUNG|nr:hypothetical protein H4R34_002861 [Dimargaris verticillata]